MGRALAAAEHDELRRRLLRLGPERIADVMDLAPTAIEEWLADRVAT